MGEPRIPVLVGWGSESELFDDFGIYAEEMKEMGATLLLGYKEAIGEWDISGIVVFCIDNQLYIVAAYQAREVILRMDPLPIFDRQWSWDYSLSAEGIRNAWICLDDSRPNSVDHRVQDILNHEPPYEDCPEWL